MMERAAHGQQDRAHAFDIGRLAAGQKDQRPGFRLRPRSRERRVNKAATGRGKGPGEALDTGQRQGGAFNPDSPFGQPVEGRPPQPDLGCGVVVTQHREDNVLSVRCSARRRHPARALGQHVRGTALGAVPDGQVMAGGEQSRGHPRTHGPKAEESNLRHLRLH
nr:hypothetical protein [Hankyongella ginsenosidimutans]